MDMEIDFFTVALCAFCFFLGALVQCTGEVILMKIYEKELIENAGGTNKELEG